MKGGNIAYLLSLGVIFSLIYQCGKPTEPASDAYPLDSSRVVIIAESVYVQDTASRRKLDSIKDAFRRRPVREVVRWLPGHVESVAVVESVSVPSGVVVASADSLAQCWHDRDSVTRSVDIWKARLAVTDSARARCGARKAVPPEDPPSRLTWASVGFGAALLFILSITTR